MRHGGEPIGNLGRGPTCLTANVAGGFLSRPSDEATARAILRALGISHLLAVL